MSLKNKAVMLTAIATCLTMAVPYYCVAANEPIATISEADVAETTSLSINVYDATNDPDHTINEPIGAGYELIVTNVNTGEVNTIKTDDNGNAGIDEIPAGVYTVTLTGKGDNTSKKYMTVTSNNMTLQANIGMTLTLYTKDISDRAMLSFAFCEYKDGTPNTSVKYAPIGAKVTITNKESGNSYTGESNDKGLVLFKEIEEGDYTFVVDSMPEGYSAAVSEGSVSNITVKGSKTMNIPTYVNEMQDLSLTFALKQWIPIADKGTSDHEKIKYNLCKYENKQYTVVKTFEYSELINEAAHYNISAEDRNFAWYLVLANPEECGYTAEDISITEATSAGDLSQETEITYNIGQPDIITNDITIKGNAGNKIRLYLCDTDMISKLDTKTDITAVIPDNGILTLTGIPFGKYFIDDLTTGSRTELDIIKAGKSQTVSLPLNDDCHVEIYRLYDAYGNLVEEKNGSVDDITKPASQGNKTALYTLEIEAGNPYSPVSTAIMRTVIRIYDDGHVEDIKTPAIGDGNGDNEFSVADAVALQKFLLNAEPHGCPNWKTVDIDCDDMLTVFDLCQVKQMLITVMDKTN